MENLEKIYFNREKEDNWYLMDKYKNDDLKWVGAEVEMEVIIDVKTHKHKIVSINGIKISEDIYI